MEVLDEKMCEKSEETRLQETVGSNGHAHRLSIDTSYAAKASWHFSSPFLGAKQKLSLLPSQNTALSFHRLIVDGNYKYDVACRDTFEQIHYPRKLPEFYKDACYGNMPRS